MMPNRTLAALLLALALACRLEHGAGSVNGIPIQEIQADQIGALVHGSGSRPTMLHVYATWCRHCNELDDCVSGLVREYGTRVNFVVLSTDEDPVAFRDWYAKRSPSYPPVRVLPWRRGEFTAAVASAGGKYRNGIPYTAFFDSAGALKDDVTGGSDCGWYRETLAAQLNSR
jgi:thiol-disulfide isomerase/thioredoxin